MAVRPRRRLTRRRVAAVVAGSIVLLGFGTGVVFASTATTPDYRTAVAELGSVDETLAVNGTIASATRRDLAFEVAGTVDAIDVEVGDVVSAGDTLAELDTEELQAAVDAAESLVSQAQQKLSSDLDSQTSSSSDSSDSGDSSSSGSGGSGGSTGPTPAETAAIAAVIAAQQNLLTLIDAADAALATSQAAASAASTDCAPFLAATLPAAGDPNDPAYDPAAEAAALAAALADAQSKLTTCQSSTSAATTALTATSSAQAAVSAAMTALDDAIAQLQTALAGSTGGPSTDAPSTPDSDPAATDLGAATASAADIVADRAAIASAEAQVALAQQQLGAATLTSPIDGTVARIAFAEGDAVTAGATDTVISVIGDDGYVIESTVSLAQIAKVEVGQSAAVTIASSGDSYTGTVSAVGITNVSETSTPAYAITVSVDAAGDTLLNGAAATADVSVASQDSVLTVPISALHSDDSGDTVDVLVDGTVTATPVEVGAIGADTVEITSGLEAGDVVVLADLDEEIATSDSSEPTGLSGLTDGVDGGEFQGPPPGFTPPEGFTGPSTQVND
jgi:multidrug efflux pump subunit AcrA (membrane-fusion protein)